MSLKYRHFKQNISLTKTYGKPVVMNTWW